MQINDQFPLRNNGFSNTVSNFNIPRHRWYYFKEGFSPNLVDYALSKNDISKDDLVIDPFNGSGTVTLTAAKSGCNALGIEVNPFAAFLSEAKLATPSIKAFKEKVRIISTELGECKKQSPLLNFSTFSQNSVNDKWLFNMEVLNSLSSGLLRCSYFKEESVKSLIKLGLIGAAMDNANVKRDGKCLRYKSNWQDYNYNKETLINSFLARASAIAEDLEACLIVRDKTRIIKGDCRKEIKNLKGSFKLCITSPPYLNSFDYSDVYRPELFLGNFLRSALDLRLLRRETLRSHAAVRASELSNKSFGAVYDNTLNNILQNQSTDWQKKVPIMIKGYFEDMELIMSDLKNKCSSDGQLWLIVSNSAYSGIEVPVDLILADIGSKLGWILEEIGVLRHIHKRGSKYSPDVYQLRESVIIFKKGNRK